MPIQLYHRDGQQCLVFTELCREGGEVVQSASSWSSTMKPAP